MSVRLGPSGIEFMGQTGLLTFGNGFHAWGGLVNPEHSGVDLWWRGFTVTNYTPEPFTVEIWLNSSSLGEGERSRHVASANQAVRPIPAPKVELRDADRLQIAPHGGRFSFIRVAEPKATISGQPFQDLLFLPPGSSIVAFMRSPENQGVVRSRLAFEWREQEISPG